MLAADVKPELATGVRRFGALTAAALGIRTGRGRVLAPQELWTSDVWQYYDTLGEFRFGVDWRANTISRIRLRAARVVPGQDEPEIVDAGPAAEFVDEFMGDVGSRAQMLATISTLLDVPGESFVVGEAAKGADGTVAWRVCSADEIRRHVDQVQVVDVDDSSTTGAPVWRTLVEPYFVTRIWRPHKRMAWRADSAARPARNTMRELDLVNRRIQAAYLSRLASAGIVIFPDEAALPVRPALADEDDPFVAEWIETAREAIATPGTASAVVPIPMRMPAEYADKVRFLDFTTADDDKLIEKRDSAIKRLATQLDLPAEILLGLGDVNHWGAWQIEESAIKLHILPPVEMICHGLTVACMRPVLESQHVDDPGQWIFWYDASEVTQRPDKSTAALAAYDRFELTGEALRRETGFDESDAPNDDELEKLILKRAATNPQLAYAALHDLTGWTTTSAPTASGTGAPKPPPPTDDEPPADATGPPGTRDAQPPPPDGGAPTGTDATGDRRWYATEPQLDRAVVEAHELQVDSWPNRVTVHHPTTCVGPQARCAVTWQMFRRGVVGPRTPGRYGVVVGPNGGAVVGAYRAQPTLDDPTRAGQVT